MAFYGWASLISAEISSKVISIGKSAFESCSGLETVNIGECVESNGVYAFQSYSSLKSITITSLVTLLGYEAFKDWLGIETVTIEKSVKIIGDCAFECCSSLKNITIPNSVTSIGYLAFRDCSGIETVTIGEGVETTGDYAFHSCSSLKFIYFYGEISPTVSSSAFINVSASNFMTLETYQNDIFGSIQRNNNQRLPSLANTHILTIAYIH